VHRHDLDVWFPIELVVDEDAEVAYYRRSMNLEGPATRNLQVNRRLEGSDKCGVGLTGLECDEFRFVWVEAEAVAQEPISDSEETVDTFLDDRLIRGSSGYDGAVIDVR